MPSYTRPFLISGTLPPSFSSSSHIYNPPHHTTPSLTHYSPRPSLPPILSSIPPPNPLHSPSPILVSPFTHHTPSSSTRPNYSISCSYPSFVPTPLSTAESPSLSSSKPSSPFPPTPLPSLTIAHAYIQNHPIRILFDEGSQINLISHTIVKRLTLPVHTFHPPLSIRGANNHLSTTNTFVPNLLFSIPAYTHIHKTTHLRFTAQPLLTHSPFDLILGIPFIRHFNLVHHYCNHTLIYISAQGTHLTIPLIHSFPTRPCRHSFCPFLDISQLSQTHRRHFLNLPHSPPQFLPYPTPPLHSSSTPTPPATPPLPFQHPTPTSYHSTIPTPPPPTSQIHPENTSSPHATTPSSPSKPHPSSFHSPHTKPSSSHTTFPCLSPHLPPIPFKLSPISSSLTSPSHSSHLPLFPSISSTTPLFPIPHPFHRPSPPPIYTPPFSSPPPHSTFALPPNSFVIYILIPPFTVSSFVQSLLFPPSVTLLPSPIPSPPQPNHPPFQPIPLTFQPLYVTTHFVSIPNFSQTNSLNTLHHSIALNTPSISSPITLFLNASSIASHLTNYLRQNDKSLNILIMAKLFLAPVHLAPLFFS